MLHIKINQVKLTRLIFKKMQNIITKWLLGQTAINIYSISFVWASEYIYNKNYNIKNMNSFHWWCITVILFFSFSLLLKYIFSILKNREISFEFRVLNKFNYIQDIHNFEKIEHIDFTESVVPSFETNVETLNKLLVIFENDIKKYKVILVNKDGGFMFPVKCENKHKFCIISIKGSDLCQGDGLYKIIFKPL
jgi:hypothetical protein